MKLLTMILLLISIALGSVACGNDNTEQPDETDDTGKYKNPVVAYSLPDPAVIIANDGFYYLYATEDSRNVPIHRSEDLVSWKFLGTVFTESTRPTFEPNGGIWVLDINYINNQYIIHYSMSVWGGEWTCCIGIATSDKPEGPFTYKGKLFRSNEIEVQNSIDPFYIEEGEQKYPFWGSFRGNYGIDLSSDGISLLPGSVKQMVAGTAYKGTYIHKRNGFYYLFASKGSCCEGANSTYTAVVGRSEHLMGPNFNKSGQNMSDNKHEILIKGNDRFVATGHNSEMITDNEGKTWILYHAVDKTNPKGRVIMLDEVQWVNNWPVGKNYTPSMNWENLHFKTLVMH